MQLVLPFHHLSIPERHLQWMHEANAADYPERKFWFYPFKSRFCRAHGVTDGFDLQVITLKCWCGDGIWRGMEYTVPERFWERCWRCNGTGIYMKKEIALVRWIISTHLFHEPSTFLPNPNLMRFHDRIEGLVKHDPVPATVGRRAMERLFLRYETQLFLRLWNHRWQMWKMSKGETFRMHVRHVNRLLSRKDEDQGVPF